jgi:hypothetical protein
MYPELISAGIRTGRLSRLKKQNEAVLKSSGADPSPSHGEHGSGKRAVCSAQDRTSLGIEHDEQDTVILELL